MEKMEKEEIRQIRGSLTQAAFAHKIGVTVQTVSNLETGRCKPSKQTLNKLLKYKLRNKKFRGLNK